MKMTHHSKKILVSVAAVAALAVGAWAMPSSASTIVNATLRVSHYQYSNVVKDCAVSVPEGSSGIAVLSAAVSSGCISSYVAVETSFGNYISCIDGLCEQAVLYWAMRENCQFTDYGVDDFHADEGDELSFTYETWAAFAVDMVADPCDLPA